MRLQGCQANMLVNGAMHASPLRLVAMRSLHASSCVRSAGESDSELSAKLQQEISYEQESAPTTGEEGVDPNAEPSFLTDFKNQGVWKIVDQAGSDEIALTRDFGNEHIRILFSIGDIDSSEAEMDENDEVDVKEDEDSPAFPVRCAITISKQNQGALTVDAQAVDGAFNIQNISFYKDDKLATDLTAEADWARRGLYIGPQFETLDEGVQAQFESFLEERGLSTDLALFIPNYAEFKEQREYCAWLENVKDFVDA